MVFLFFFKGFRGVSCRVFRGIFDVDFFGCVIYVGLVSYVVSFLKMSVI